MILVYLCAAVGGIAAGRSFPVVWNAPSAQCAQYGVPLNPEQYGIRTNLYQDTFGYEMNLFFTLGAFPKIEKGKPWFNGGVPQNGDLNLHLTKAANDINSIIPNEDFNGLAVIDFEDWRPVWPLTAGTQQKYKDASINLVRQAHPTWTDKKINDRAKLEFETAGRKFLYATLELAKRMRPHGKWGYYGYPYVDNYDKGKYNVSSGYRAANDELQFLFNNSTALYTSIYIFKDDLTSAERGLQVQGRIDETLRLRKNKSTPIYPYFWYSYHEVQEFLTYDDLVATIGTVYKNGLDGIVIWGGTSEMDSYSKCKRLNNYLDTVLGPYIENLLVSALIYME